MARSGFNQIDSYDYNLNLHPVCAVNVLLNNEQILDHFYKQLCLRIIIS